MLSQREKCLCETCFGQRHCSRRACFLVFFLGLHNYEHCGSSVPKVVLIMLIPVQNWKKWVFWMSQHESQGKIDMGIFGVLWCTTFFIKMAMQEAHPLQVSITLRFKWPMLHWDHCFVASTFALLVHAEKSMCVFSSLHAFQFCSWCITTKWWGWKFEDLMKSVLIALMQLKQAFELGLEFWQGGHQLQSVDNLLLWFVNSNGCNSCSNEWIVFCF